MLFDGRIKPHESVVFERVQDELVLLHMKTGTYYGLNAVGARMWELLISGADRDTVLAKLQDEYRVTREQLEQDLDTLISELDNNELLVRTQQ